MRSEHCGRGAPTKTSHADCINMCTVGKESSQIILCAIVLSLQTAWNGPSPHLYWGTGRSSSAGFALVGSGNSIASFPGWGLGMRLATLQMEYIMPATLPPLQGDKRSSHARLLLLNSSESLSYQYHEL